jgi:hypothetical protein
MAQTPFSSFENQLQQSANNLTFKPSDKVWQNVESNMNNNTIGGSVTNVSSIAKSLLSNWILNIVVPAVVLIGGGSFFYANYNSNTNATTENEATSVSTASTNENTNINSKVTPANNEVDNLNGNVKSEHALTNHHIVTAEATAQSSDNQNNSNAVNYSLGYGNVKDSQKGGKLNGLLTSNKLPTADNDQFANSAASVFTPSDIDKIAKKEVEKNSKSEYKERNLKSVDFTE